ncbi:MAG: hypothetical protein PHG81_11955 [Aliarcobacter sp.]|nr:hypothetical protein [Aliarcobacter sp.]
MKNSSINNHAVTSTHDNVSGILGLIGAVVIAKSLFSGINSKIKKIDTLEEELKDLHITEIKIKRYKNRAAVYDNLIDKYNVTKPSNVLSIDFMNSLIKKSLDSHDSLLHYLELKQIILNNIQILESKHI